MMAFSDDEPSPPPIVTPSSRCKTAAARSVSAVKDVVSHALRQTQAMKSNLSAQTCAGIVDDIERGLFLIRESKSILARSRKARQGLLPLATKRQRQSSAAIL